MKKLLLATLLVAVASVTGLQAAETKAKDSSCSSCCSKKSAITKADSTAKGASHLIAKR
jgi:positive regulator of sigma E activity